MSDDLISARPRPFVVAADRQVPGVWVERLVVFASPGGEIVRDVRLHRGLNVVWSQDQAGVLGHSAGKTLFCRLIQYVLGEPDLADASERDKVGAAFPEGVVGAVVHVRNEPWAIVRPLGHSRLESAAPGTDIDSLALGRTPSAIPFRDWRAHVSNALLETSAAEAVPGCSATRPAWLTALAWLTRDQGCRLRNALSWRTRPSGAMKKPRERWVAACALLGIRTTEHADLEATRYAAGEALQAAQRELDAAGTLVRLAYEGATGALRVPRTASPEGHLPALQQAADQGMREVRALSAERVAAATQAYDDAVSQHDGLTTVLIERQTLLAVCHERVTELEGLEGQLHGTAPGARCPTCGAELSLEAATRCQQELHRTTQSLAEERGRESTLRAEAERLKGEARSAKQGIRACREARDAAILAATSESEASAAMWKAKIAVNQLAAAIDERARARAAVGLAKDRRDALGKSLHLEAPELSARFHDVVCALYPTRVRGSVLVRDGALEPIVDGFGGEAMTSLNVVAFDLAVLRLAMEGLCALPAFLVHDSPREADLGQSLYASLFDLVRAWHDDQVEPAFQYIITTTSAPPLDLQQPPWNVIPDLAGEPEHRRLLKRMLR